MQESPDALSRVCATCFLASAPFLMPQIDALHHVLDTGYLGAIGTLSLTPFMWTMDIAAMFTSLAMLLITLFRTDYAGLSRATVLAGVISYLVGYLALGTAFVSPGYAPTVLNVAGVPLGIGLGITCMAWATQAGLSGFSTSVKGLAIAFAAMAASAALAFIIPPAAGYLLLFALAAVGSLGSLRGRAHQKDQRGAVAGSNWWDVFGKLDLSLVEGESNAQPLVSRALFFVVTPCLILLLFVLAGNIPEVPSPWGVTPSVFGAAATAALAIPLFLIHDERSLVNFSFRIYLPLLAACVFVIDAFAGHATQNVVMAFGIEIFCFMYALVATGVLATMAGRMRSLALPVASLLIFAAALVALLSYTRTDLGLINVNRVRVTMVLFVLSTVMLLVTQSSQVWRAIMQGVSAVEHDARDALAESCMRIASDNGLTARESEILPYLARGHGSAYIAEELVVAESTVRTHVQAIYRKLGVGSREELLHLIDDESHKQDKR